MSNPIKGMRLISDIIVPKEVRATSDLEKHFKEFEKYLDNDFLKFSSMVNLANEAKLYRKLMAIKEALLEDIKFAELVSKTHIGIGGSFSAGKSSFLNSILNRSVDADDILPVDARPTTSIPTYIVKKENSSKSDIDIYTFNNNAEKSKIDKEALLAISHEFDKVYSFGLISIIKKIVVDVDSMPYSNIAFLDTPGYSKSDGDKDTDKNIALTHLQNIDALIWLIDIDNGTIREGDIKFIENLNFKGDILFVINKADKKPKNDIKNIINDIKTILKKSKNIKFADVVAYSSHDKEEYFSKNVIDNFLKNNNRAKPSTYKYKLLEIINEYDRFIKEDKAEKRAVLKVLNQVDLFTEDIDDIDTILKKVKKAINSYNKSENELQKVKENFLEFGKLFDKELGGINVNCEKIFEKYGIDINKKDNTGSTPLHNSVRRMDIKEVKLLIECGADVNISDNDGGIPLHNASSLFDAKDVVKILIEAGADVNISDNDGRTPLYNASLFDAKDVAKILIEAGADVNISDNDGRTPLHYAFLFSAKDVAKVLIEAGADINIKDNDGETPLDNAYYWNAKDVAKVLIDAGAE